MSPSPIQNPNPQQAAQKGAQTESHADFFKYHGLGNVYLVIEPGRFSQELSPSVVKSICDPHLGVGADGILLGPLPSAKIEQGPRVVIFNSDGSQAEKSGNGLRIFAYHLWVRGFVSQSPFRIDTAGGVVRARMGKTEPRLGETRLSMEMGRVRFDSSAIPMTGPEREVLGEPLEVEGSVFTVSAANVGNPHCVVEVEGHSADPFREASLARQFGSLIENHPAFPNRTNVQFLTVVDAHRIRIGIWERGSGFTLSSGTSSCAAAAVACRSGRCSSPVTVEMPGGTMTVLLDPDFNAELEGPVVAVEAGRFSDLYLSHLALSRA